jgi:hypothetical protein
MGLFKNQPGCACCCPDCVECVSYLSGLALSDYTEVAGSWSIGTTIDTTSSNALLIHDDAVPSGYHGGEMVAGFRIPGSTIGLVWDLRFVFLYADSDNYAYLKCTQNGFSGEFSIWEVVGGTHSQSGASYVFTSSGRGSAYTYTFALWYDEVIGRALLFGPKNLAQTSFDICILLDEELAGIYDPSIYGTLLGFGTGTVDASYDPAFQASWQAFDVYACDQGPCQYTDYNGWPISLEIELQGFAASSDPCPTCSSINAVYIVDNERVACTLGVRACYYTAHDYDVSCGNNPFNGQPYPVVVAAYLYSDSVDACGNDIVKLAVFVRALRSDSPESGTISGFVALPSSCGKTDAITNIQELEVTLDTLSGWEFCDYSNAVAIVTAS